MKYLFVFLLVGLMFSCGMDGTLKQPNCDEMEGLQTAVGRLINGKFADDSLVPNDYTGVVFTCDRGKVIEQCNFKDGKRDGLSLDWWHENGQLRAAENYKDGKLHGVSRRWQKNGQMMWEWNHKDGKADGLYTRWQENGKYVESNWKDGRIISIKCYNDHGKQIYCK